MRKILFFILAILVYSCKSKVEKIKPSTEPISESIYASGSIKSKNQYQLFSTVNGIIEQIYVTEGDSVKKGDAILRISNEAQKLSKDNALLTARFSDFNNNQEKLNEATLLYELAKNKLKNDSANYFRQLNLWQQKIGSKLELEQRELAYQNAKTAYFSAGVKRDDLKRQLDLSSSQSKNNLKISSKLESDFTIKSEIDGIVYSLTKTQGDLVGLQTQLGVIGDAKDFILEMQVDEYDILKIKKDLPVMISMDSYKGQVFEAKVTRIIPLMNERNKTFLVEAAFVNPPKLLYPNINFEANIVIQSKDKALTIPRSYLLNDSTVLKSNGDSVRVKTGLKDYQKVEIISGISDNDELTKPVQ